MFEIDRRKFGAFLSALRKEKGFTQKELAERLYISDKAVSKWETGVSFPDTALLIPIADLFGVTVTELLMCERTEKQKKIDADQVETLVKTAITYSENHAERAYRMKSKWPLLFICSVAVGILGAVFCYLHHLRSETLLTCLILGTVFGTYFCFLAKTTLPQYYDENKCGLYYDGPFRMNLPGIALNNSNWPYILRAGRIWSCLTVALYPTINAVMAVLIPDQWCFIELYAALIFLLGGLFIPIYVVGKRYE